MKRLIGSAVLSLAACGAAAAGPSPIGVWMDQTGRGAVEIIDCGGKLCGHIVWVKDAKHNDGCNFQIIGNVKPISSNRWDNGWIIDPERDPKRKYDVEITTVGEQKLKVVGYMGSKFFSESMTWTRAPADLKKCSEVAAKPEAAPAAPAETPRREAEAQPKAPPPPPPPAAAPAPAEPEAKPAKPKTASRKSKDCKVNFGGYNFKVPCSALE